VTAGTELLDSQYSQLLEMGSGNCVLKQFRRYGGACG
jgi:hypothetical protein